MWHNLIVFFLLFFVQYGSIIAAYRYFREYGLFVFIPLSLVIANIQVLELVNILGFTTALGNIAYSSTFLISDVLGENHGKQKAYLGVQLGFVSLIFFTIVLTLTGFYIPAEEDVMHDHLQTLFTFVPRMIVAGFCAYLCSQFLDVWLLDFLRIRLHFNLFSRNNLSTMFSQLVDTMVFGVIAFGIHFQLGAWEVTQVYSWQTIIEISLTAYGLKFVLALMDTPFIYWAKRMKTV